MSVIIHRPRRVIRETLSDPLNHAKFDTATRMQIDAILAKPDEEWSRYQFRKMLALFGDCDE
jgi:hypothetical protein